MKKIELLVNLENYQNITFHANEGMDRLEAYEELLAYVEDWIGYSQYALKLANHIRKILGVDPYEVEYQEFEVVNEVEIKKQPKSTKKMEPNGLYNVAKTKCNKCNGYISWDGYNKDNPSPPIHVTMDGRIIGNGDCPMFDGGG